MKYWSSLVLTSCAVLTACGLAADEGTASRGEGLDELPPSVGSTTQALSASRIKGHVDAVQQIDGSWYISGWACETGQSRSIRVLFFSSNSSSSSTTGILEGSTRASLPSSAAVASACGSTLLAHRYRFAIPQTTLQLRGGAYIHVVGVKATDSAVTAPLTGSGSFRVARLAENYACSETDANRCVFPSASANNTLAILSESHPSDTTTHRITSGGVALGISSFGGGYINELSLPGVGDIIGATAGRFGRGAQSAIRDRLHRAVYNPTQAGFSDEAGTSVRVTATRDGQTLVLPPRRVATYNADGHYDYVKATDLARDRYLPANADKDNYADTGAQADEVTSEFDFYGTYANCRDGAAIVIPCFKHYYEYRFVRTTAESATLKQFIEGTLEDGDGAVLDRNLLGHTITPLYGPAIGTAGPYDLGQLIARWTLRFDNAVWNPSFLFYLKQGNVLSRAVARSGARTEAALSNKLTNPLGAGYERALILSTSSNPARGTAVALYKPRSATNAEPIVTKVFSGRTLLRESRRTSDDFFDNNAVLSTVGLSQNMSKLGFTDVFTGLINPTKLNRAGTALAERKYELLRSEVYLLIGTPLEIRDTIARIASSTR